MYTEKLTDEDREKMYQWALEGVPLREIVNRFNNKVSYQRVHQLLKRNGVRPKSVRDIQKLKDSRETLLLYLAKFFKGESVIVDAETLECALARYELKRKQNPEFQVAFEDIEWHTHCPVFGMRLDYQQKNKNKDDRPSFDRIDNTKGYVKGNVCVVSYKANRIKNDGTAEDHRLISNYMFQRGAK